MLHKDCGSESVWDGMWEWGESPVLEKALSIGANGTVMVSLVGRSCYQTLMPDLKPGSRNVLASPNSRLAAN